MRTATIEKHLGTTLLVCKEQGSYSLPFYGIATETGVHRRNKSTWGGAYDGVRIALTDKDGTPLMQTEVVTVAEALGLPVRRNRYGSPLRERDRHAVRPLVDDFGNVVTREVQRTKVVRPADVRETLADRQAIEAEAAAAEARREAQRIAEAANLDDVVKGLDETLAKAVRSAVLSGKYTETSLRAALATTETEVLAPGVLIRLTRSGYSDVYAKVDGEWTEVATHEFGSTKAFRVNLAHRILLARTEG